ncbi:hypothetical protein AMET1_0006 [Methanonatronarchaeum thermophilum]|uniref:Uncharacterized protein n=1 Tax=Methanonatronarchaeum thermophilum TaxID=1927129 RepID=A0A1Y3GDN6_9EURY|nr:hypothetical protein [Methanonatronarchaeum thermophilum]OUJ19337.1 hypothetical protein AMET1_0006 [Methanonatronarchaeum thermophilum]
MKKQATPHLITAINTEETTRNLDNSKLNDANPEEPLEERGKSISNEFKSPNPK